MNEVTNLEFEFFLKSYRILFFSKPTLNADFNSDTRQGNLDLKCILKINHYLCQL